MRPSFGISDQEQPQGHHQQRKKNSHQTGMESSRIGDGFHVREKPLREESFGWPETFPANRRNPCFRDPLALSS